MRLVGYGLLALFLFLDARRVVGQIDPEHRKLVQLGFYQPLEGASPKAGYAFYYWNQPGFIRTNLTLRMAVAPVYLDSELGFGQALGERTDVGVGVAGGGYANSYYEFQRGKYVREESFTGHGGGFSASVYHLFNPTQRIPLTALVRIAPYYTVYERDNETAPNFELPPDQASFNLRSGFRWGGKAPVISPDLAMEISAWYEGRIRSDSGAYGFGDRELEFASHLFWGRGLLSYTLPELKHRFEVSLNAGTSVSADRFSAYRLGGDLPLTSEFPLFLPGYFYQELSADRFVSFSGSYTVPLDPAKRWNITGVSTLAVLDYLPGFEQEEHFQPGVGIGLGYRSRSGRWQLVGSYGYGFNAIRSHGYGAQTIGFICQVDLEAKPTPIDQAGPEKWRGLFQFLQNFF